MRNQTRLTVSALLLFLSLARPVVANDVDAAAKKLVEEVVATAGGVRKNG